MSGVLNHILARNPPPSGSFGVPTYVGKSTDVSGTAAVSPNFTSSGRLAGHLLILVAASANEPFTDPSGWTQVSSSPQGIGSVGVAGGIGLAVWTKVSDGTETTVTVADTGNHTYAVGIVISPASGASVSINAQAGRTNGSNTAASGNALITTLANCLVVDIFATDRDASGLPSYSGEANSDLTGLTERHDSTVAIAAGSGLCIYTGEKATAGSMIATTATGPNNGYCVITLALANV